MSDIILKAENLSKQYRLGLVGLGTAGHDLNRFWHKIRGKEDPYLQIGSVNDRSAKASSQYVWALQDINFEVKRGEVLGIIGKNGAGKSTLLKILSRVTAPTTGSIKTKGRIASLLEVGTGMHPELTGRENIFLNGAILGMTKAEIRSKIDEIVDFSGCAMYIDTPVKRYSSGMRVRLGFAVAAFLEPDILVVDEVLAVGDAEFQKKAIGKMQDISTSSGRTVLFVSHNMASIRALCNRVVILDKGSVAYDGSLEDGIKQYLKQDSKDLKNFRSNDSSLDTNYVKIHEVLIYAYNKKKDDLIHQDDKILFEIYFTKKVEKKISFNFRIKDKMENYLFTHASGNQIDNDLVKGEFVYRMIIPQDIFNEGEFNVDFGCIDRGRFHFIKDDYLTFEIIHRTTALGSYTGPTKGALKLNLKWEQGLKNNR